MYTLPPEIFPKKRFRQIFQIVGGFFEGKSLDRTQVMQKKCSQIVAIEESFRSIWILWKDNDK